MVTIGEENALLADYHRVIRDGIEASLPFFKPGPRLSDAITAAEKVAESAGYEFRFPSGHYCGLNVVEPRIGMESNDILRPGMVFIFHPCVGEGGTQVFSGETYAITSDGYECLNQAPQELTTV